ncbi:MAG: hypothetical protein IPI39_18510 [Candidatus Obscuribacter sp.]|nr:hypothetical protein [Candidatus Obscuribacter sp.]
MTDSANIDLKGQKIVKAQSSLNAFAIYFASGKALLISAVDDELGPDVDFEVKGAGSVPEQNEAVCSVDWSWIYGKEVQSVSRGRGGYGPSIRMDLGNNLVITTSVGIWDGKAFLSFMPFKPQ